MQNMLFAFFNPGFTGAFAFGWVGLFVLLNILFTVAVWNDAERLRNMGRATVLLSPFVWGLATLLLGLPALALYWLVHHSRLARKE